MKVSLNNVMVDDQLGAVFRTKPTQMGPVTIAVFDDTCGSFI